MFGEDLHADGQVRFVFRLPAGHRDAGDAGQAGGDGVDVREVHLEGIVQALAEFESGDGRGRGNNHVNLVERFDEVTGDERSDFLRLEVIGVVVARAQHVGPEHDAPLDFRPEAPVARFLVHVSQLVMLGGAEAVAHPVVSREI